MAANDPKAEHDEGFFPQIGSSGSVIDLGLSPVINEPIPGRR